MKGMTASEWPLKRLKDITTKIGSGATPRGGKNGYRAEGISLIRSLNVYDFSFSEDDLAFIGDEQAAELDNVVVQKNDILLNITGASVARCCMVNPKHLPARVNQHVAIIRVRPNVADARFILYCINSLQFKSRLLALAQGGATREALTKTTIENFEVCQPPLSVQHRIADILSAYDELIENSQKRIRILETMARALYREWFVQFRFPGHDKVPRITSPLGEIPQGWEVKEMQEVAEVIDCLHSKKPTECPDGPGVFLQLNNIGESGKLDMREQFRISAEDYSLWTSRIELQAGDCVITNVGRVGAVGQIPEGVKAAPGRNMTAIRPRVGRLTPAYLIEYLLSSHMTSEVAKKKDLGTIMDSLNVKGIIRLHVPCPPMDAMRKYESIARPMRKRIELLVNQIDKLRQTRDILLPRLLSGQVNVAEN